MICTGLLLSRCMELAGRGAASLGWPSNAKHGTVAAHLQVEKITVPLEAHFGLLDKTQVNQPASRPCRCYAAAGGGRTGMDVQLHLALQARGCLPARPAEGVHSVGVHSDVRRWSASAILLWKILHLVRAQS
jgi:hypothetical protein